MADPESRSGIKRSSSCLDIPCITLSPDGSPQPNQEGDELTVIPLPKRIRLMPEWQPPIPDAVQAQLNCNSTVRLDCSMHFNIQPGVCNCPRPLPNLPQICRCILTGPMPHVRIPCVNRVFDIMGKKWNFTFTELPSTPVINGLLRAQLVISAVEGELTPSQSLGLSGHLKFFAIRYDQNGNNILNDELLSFTVEIATFRNRDQFMFTLDRHHLNSLCPQPMASPSFPYPSSVNFYAELTVVVTRNVNFDIPFTLDFTDRRDLSNLVILCGNRLLYANHLYLAHHSHFFATFSKHASANEEDAVPGYVKIHKESKLPMVTMEENDYEIWKEILLFCSPCHAPIRNAFLVRAVQLADEYQFYMLKRECETRMMSLVGTVPRYGRREHSDLEYLAVAELFELNRLKELTLTTICRSHNFFFHTIQNDPFYDKLSNDLKSCLIDRAAQKPRLCYLPNVVNLPSN